MLLLSQRKTSLSWQKIKSQKQSVGVFIDFIQIENNLSVIHTHTLIAAVVFIFFSSFLNVCETKHTSRLTVMDINGIWAVIGCENRIRDCVMKVIKVFHADPAFMVSGSPGGSKNFYRTQSVVNWIL